MKKLKIVAFLFVLGVFTISCGDEFSELVVDKIQLDTDPKNDLPDPADEPE